jgi:PAS domain S-box-containing protein
MAIQSSGVVETSIALGDGLRGPGTAAVVLSGSALEAYFSLSQDAMCILGPDGTVAAANAAAGDLFGTLPVDLIGQPLSALFAADLLAAEQLMDLMAPGGWETLESHVRVPVECVTEDGESLPIDLSLIPIKENLTALTLAVMRDASDVVPAIKDSRSAAREMISGQRELLVEIGHGHGVGGIAQALHRRTRRPVLILDPFGQVLADAGYEDVDQIPEGHLVGTHSRALHGVREHQNQSWTAAARPEHQLLGSISIFDPDGSLPESAIRALEYATSILAAELLRHAALVGDGTTSLSEFTQLLLDGRAPESGSPEAGLLGYDPEAPHVAIVIDTPSERENTIDLVSQAARSVGMKRPLVTSRDGLSVLLAPEEPQWDHFTSVLGMSLGAPLHIGVGGSYKLGMIAHSLDEALFAIKVGTRLTSETPVTRFSALGVWRLLVDSNETAKLRQLVHEWIGALIEHDRLHNSELVKTLTAYLKELCTTDATALLHVHRNTLRYRLSKIALITGRDLADPDQRFQLEFACRALLVLQALEDG